MNSEFLVDCAGPLDVPSSYSTIQLAVDDADDGDVILIAPGYYTENLIIVNDKSITIKGGLNADGSLGVVIDGENQGSIFVLIGSDVGLENLAITKGSGYTGPNYGGGIYSDIFSSLTVVGCNIGNNSASEGGGVYAYNLTVVDSLISNNSSIEGGGGIFGKSNVTIVNSTISGNSCGNLGGGMKLQVGASGSIQISSSKIIGNSAGTYGGIDIVSDGISTVIQDCEITSNVATVSSGGGLSFSVKNDAVIEDCLIRGNTSITSGGGIRCFGSGAYPGTFVLSGSFVCSNADQFGIGCSGWISDCGNVIEERCGQLPGVCCIQSNINCVEFVTELDCITFGGSWLGDADCVDCPPLVKPDLVGACCLGDTCIIAKSIECLDSGGAFVGENVVCDNANCPSSGCVGDADNDGQVDVNDILVVVARFGVTCP